MVSLARQKPALKHRVTGTRRALPAGLVLLLALVLLLPAPLLAQEVSVNIGDDGSLSARGIQLILLITVLSLAPGILITITCFPFMVTVLSILRQALGLQQSPPNMLIVSLAMFLTYFIMEPVFQQAWSQGIQPFVDEQIEADQAIPLALEPFRVFMAARMDPETFEAMAALRPDSNDIPTGPEAPLSVLVPSFMLSEIARAFQIGFLLYLPFLIIDLVVAAVLMSMGMMMVPPAIVSLPFKLAFFVVADGWALVTSSLVRSYF
ncbi:flagellar type III secretion system pore protein FliP [Pseudooceanicola sp. HF7]|nr:flagellar type III secretion system pore protein FliP [Pseudooceanicola sp. HF7]